MVRCKQSGAADSIFIILQIWLRRWITHWIEIQNSPNWNCFSIGTSIGLASYASRAKNSCLGHFDWPVVISQLRGNWEKSRRYKHCRYVWGILVPNLDCLTSMVREWCVPKFWKGVISDKRWYRSVMIKTSASIGSYQLLVWAYKANSQLQVLFYFIQFRWLLSRWEMRG
jgi:hypothetical protein